MLQLEELHAPYRHGVSLYSIPYVTFSHQDSDIDETLERLEGGERAMAIDAHVHTPRDLEPWASNSHPTDVPRWHVEELATGKHTYTVVQGGTMDGENCRTPQGSWLPLVQTWESNRAVRMENVGETDIIDPWLSNGSNNFRDIEEIVAGAIEPGMTDREKAIALYYLEVNHRFHAHTGDDEGTDPVKVFNVYGFTTCGHDSICLAGLWRSAGLKRRPAHPVGHCITQVFYDGAWHLLDADMQCLYLMRDNHTIAGEKEIVHDHDLVKRTHTEGFLLSDDRAKDEWEAALFVYEGDAGGSRDAPSEHTMNMTLRPGEALTWRWGQLRPVRYHGVDDITTMFGQKATDTICNGRWEYRPDFTGDVWQRGADRVENVRVTPEGLAAESGKTGTVVWTMRSPYVLAGGRLEVEGGAQFSLSWDGKSWREVGEDLDPLFPRKGTARYQYQLRCELSGEAQLKSLGIVNDLQMAMLSLPGMAVGENGFVYTDESPGERQVRITHEWVERSASAPPEAPPAPVFPSEGGETEGTDIVFAWVPPADPDGKEIADYHFELSEYPDLRWPLSPNFRKLVSNTVDRDKAQYTLPYVGLLTSDCQYYWRVRAQNAQGVWGLWSQTWSFTPRAPGPPVDVTLDFDADQGIGTLHWKANPVGRPPVNYRVYGSDEKGFSVSDEPYDLLTLHAGDWRESKLSSRFPANFVAETTGTELVVGEGLEPANANRAFYRVVAVDEHGNRSGSSEYAAAPRPFIYTRPVATARVGEEYRYQVGTIRSLGDLSLRPVEREQVAHFWDIGQRCALEQRPAWFREVVNFWDVQEPGYSLEQGPAWLEIDATTGLLTGTPDAPGKVQVVVAATLQRQVQELDPDRLAWGRRQVTSVATEEMGPVTQEFVIEVHNEKGMSMNSSPHIFFMAHPGHLQDWFWRGRSKERAEELGYDVSLNTREGPLSSEDWAELLVGVQALLTTWGSPRLDESVLSKNDTLRIVGHVGGSLAGIVSPVLYERGVRVCTANRLMARTVAEWSLMMTLVGLRKVIGYGQFGAGGTALNWAERSNNLVPTDAIIGVWGYGDVARWFIELLGPLQPQEIIVHDKFLSAEKAADRGIRKVEFEELFRRADVIHCLTSLTEANKGQIGAEQLAAVRDGAVLVNCGRAALIQEEALIDALRKNRFTAIMDVFEVEPLAEDHPYRGMANVILTPHNAGYGRDEYYLGAMLDEFERFFRGAPLQTEVTQERAFAMTDASLMRKAK